MLDSSAALQDPDIGGKGFGSDAGDKGFGSEVSESAGSKSFSANTGGKGLSLNASGSASDEESNDDKKKPMYVLQCQIPIQIIAIKLPDDEDDDTHALGRRFLPDGTHMLYDMVVKKSTRVHGPPPDGCTWNDLPDSSFP